MKQKTAIRQAIEKMYALLIEHETHERYVIHNASIRAAIKELESLEPINEQQIKEARTYYCSNLLSPKAVKVIQETYFNETFEKP